MDNKNTIIIRDTSTGAGQAGLTVKLYSKVDGSWAEFCTCSGVTGKAGAYVPDVNVPLGFYKLYVNGSVDTSWDGGSTDGREYGYIGAAITAAVAAEATLRQNADTAITDAITALDLTLVHKTGAETILGLKQLRTLPQGVNGSGLPLFPSQPGELVNLSFISSICLSIYNGLPLPGNVVIVDASIPVSYEGHYKTIQEAINYINGLDPAPGSTNQYYIWIFPAKNRGTGYTENITMQNYIHLVGVGGTPKIVGSLTGAGATNTFENLYWEYNGNLTLSSLIMIRCTVAAVSSHDPVLTLNTCKLLYTMLFAYSSESGTPTIVSSGNNLFANCFCNTEFTPDATDKGKIEGFGDKTIAPIY